MKEVKRIMFVCLGNICRSPMAEFIFKDLIKQKGLEENYFVRSSATSNEEEGNPVYPPAKAELLKHGISCAGKYAVQLVKSDYDKYDLFIGMDSSNVRNMKYLFNGDPQNKVKKLLDLTPSGGDVADPWYYGNFDKTYSDVKRGCEALLALLEEN